MKPSIAHRPMSPLVQGAGFPGGWRHLGEAQLRILDLQGRVTRFQLSCGRLCPVEFGAELSDLLLRGP
jgi:hypothetical protein